MSFETHVLVNGDSEKSELRNKLDRISIVGDRWKTFNSRYLGGGSKNHGFCFRWINKETIGGGPSLNRE